MRFDERIGCLPTLVRLKSKLSRELNRAEDDAARVFVRNLLQGIRTLVQKRPHLVVLEARAKRVLDAKAEHIDQIGP